MKYTQKQKKCLEQRLLDSGHGPRLFVQGGAIVITPKGEVHGNLARYANGDLLLSIEDAGNPRNPALRHYAHNSKRDIRNELAMELQPCIRRLAQEYGHQDTPYRLTDAMKQRLSSTAHAMAHGCPEETELLLRSAKWSDESQPWPMLLMEKDVELANGNVNCGLINFEDKFVLIAQDRTPHRRFKNVLEQTDTLYEELTHYADHVTANTYLEDTKGDKFLSASIFNDDRLKTALRSGSRDKERLYDSPPAKGRISLYDDHHDAILMTHLRRALRWNTRQDSDHTPLPEYDLAPHEETNPDVNCLTQLLKEILDLNLKGYDREIKAFLDHGDKYKIAREILAKTYAQTLSCRDQLEAQGTECDLDELVKFVATGAPKHGKAMYVYTKTRDEYLAQLRKKAQDPDFIPPSVGHPNRWRERLRAGDRYASAGHRPVPG